jgi:hypothetical protein
MLQLAAVNPLKCIKHSGDHCGYNLGGRGTDQKPKIISLKKASTEPHAQLLVLNGDSNN